MGTLYYGSRRSPIEIEDRLLSHLKVVITSKQRRNEGFLLSWTEPSDSGHGRSSVWIHPQCDLIYRFEGGRAPELDRELLDRLSVESSSATGLKVDAAMIRNGWI
jgi:hypothetical protein